MELLKALWVLIPIGIYIFFTKADRKHRKAAEAYFWTFLVLFGAFGFLYMLISTGRFPSPVLFIAA